MGVVELAATVQLKGFTGQTGIAVVDALGSDVQAFRCLNLAVLVIEILIQRQINIAVFGTDDTLAAVVQPSAGDPDRIGGQRAALIEQLGARSGSSH